MAKETAEFSFGQSDGADAFSMDSSGSEVTSKGSNSIEFDTDDKPREESANAETLSSGDDDPVDSKVDAAEDAPSDGDVEEGSEAELGEFNAEDPEVVAKFDAKYSNESGELDAEGALSQEFFDNAAKGIEGLNEETYKYLAAKGISKATVKQIEAMAATVKEANEKSVQAQDAKLFEIAGGADALSEALKWGKEGGYSKEQQERFNAITKGTDLVAKEEAVEALMARYKKANPAPKPELPKRDATKGQGSPGQSVKPYKNRQEMRKVRDALGENDKQGWDAHNRRLAASKFDD